jgi:colanic acid biosynthesis glycosyl transferase WcaI
VQDFELDAAFALGLLRGAWMRRAVEAGERWLLRRFDVVSTISGRMAERLAAKGVAADRIAQLPNWVDARAIAPLAQPPSLRAELGLPAGACVCLFSGTINRKQGLETVVDAARLLQARTDIAFLVCGEGDWRSRLEERAAGLPNLRFGDLQPQARLNELLNTADIHLLPQAPGAADLVMPSKLGGMLASGRPVVAAAARGTEVARMVDGAGLVVAPDDARAIADAVLALAHDAALRHRLGAAARARAERLLDRRAVLDGWIAQLGLRPDA